MIVQRIREYELQYEKSLQEARELAILARRQIAAELRGRDDTPAGDFDEEGEFQGAGPVGILKTSFSGLGLNSAVLV